MVATTGFPSPPLKDMVINWFEDRKNEGSWELERGKIMNFRRCKMITPLYDMLKYNSSIKC